MDQDTVTTIKNSLWAVAIVVCIFAFIIGIVFAMFHKYYGSADDSLAVTLGTNNASEKSDVSSSEMNGEDSNLVTIGTGSGVSRGELNILEAGEDAGDEYLSRITFLVDSTFIGLRDLSLVDTNQVWATQNGSMPIGSASTAQIVYPNDGSVITAANAAMIRKPDILVIGIGMDGLANVDEETFITQYDTLIANIQKTSPDTKIICVSLTSMIAGYTGSDGLTVTVVSDGNDWVQMVCRDTGSAFLNVAEEMDESVQLLSRFAGSNGKTLNRAGLQEFLTYLRTHPLT